MLLRELVIGADDRAGQKAPDAFDDVGMDLTDYPFLAAVIDRRSVCSSWMPL